MKITLETMISELTKAPLGVTAVRLRNLLKSQMSSSKALILLMIHQGESVNGERHRTSRGRLLTDGFIRSEDSGYVGTNFRPLKDYFLTQLGKDTIDEIIAVYTPIARKLDQVQTLVDTLQTRGNMPIDDEQGNPTTIRNLLAIYVAKLKETGLTMADIEVFIKVKQKEKQAV